MRQGLAVASGDTVEDDVDEVVVGHLGIDIESINIVQVIRHSSCLLKIADLLKSPVQLVVVTIVFPTSVCNFPLSVKSILVALPPLQRISFCT